MARAADGASSTPRAPFGFAGAVAATGPAVSNEVASAARRAGETASSWSADKSFLAALSSFTLAPNQSRTFTETFELPNAAAGWHTVRAWLPTSTGPKTEASVKVELLAAPSRCFVGGCSSQVCSDRADVVTTCDWRPQDACYRSARCERQASGQCGWTMTTALQQCLAR